MSLLGLIREKTDAVSDRTNGRFRVEVDEATGQDPNNFERYPLYSAYLFEQEHENPYALFAIDSRSGNDYPAEMRIAPERAIAPKQINSADELLSNLDEILSEDFLKEQVNLVPRRPQFKKQEQQAR